MKARVVSEHGLTMPSGFYARPGDVIDAEVEMLPIDTLQRLVDRGAVELVEED
jgi:hypothetical protein